MLSFADWSNVVPFPRLPSVLERGCRWLGTGAAALVVAGALVAAEPAGPVKGEFGGDIQLAPFVVNGKKLSISIHARTKSDRSYAEKFADEVVEIAYETIGDSTGRGLVIVGREGEPHPLVVFKKFQAMAAAGQLDPAVAAKSAELTAMMAAWKAQIHMEEIEHKTEGEVADKKAGKDRPKEFRVGLDMIMPAVPLPLEGLLSKLYQLSWAEGFDDGGIDRKLRSLTVADLESNALSKYDWVFYLPPRNAFNDVLDGMIKEFVKQEKIGLFKRAALRSALFVFKPAIKQAVEGMRKCMLYMTVLRAESHYTSDDIMLLTGAYGKVLMPDFKFTSGSEHERALEAITKQKLANVEYAKDPFVKPARLATFDPAAYAPGEGEYTAKPPEVSHRFKREGDSFQWIHRQGKPQVFYPAGDRLLVNAEGTMTIRFLVDDQGAVTGVEERWIRRRQLVQRKN